LGTGGATEQLPVVAVVKPVRSSVMALVVLAAALSWLVARPDASAQWSVQRAGTVAVVDHARTPSMASVAGPRPACGVHLSGPSSGAWLSAPSGVRPSGGRPVRWPARPVSSRLGSSSGIRRSDHLLSTCPTSGVWCPAVWCPPRPSGRVRLVPIRRGVRGQADAARQPAPRERVEVPMGCRVGVAHGRRGCRWRTRPGRVQAAAALDPGLPGRPGRRAERPVAGGCARHGSRPQREVAAPAAWLPSS
jgi:hypothetical protein